MNKIIHLILIFYFSFYIPAYADTQINRDGNVNSHNSAEGIFLGTLNSIIVTVNKLRSSSESALDVSSACEKVGEGAFNSLNSRTSFCQKFEQNLDLYDSSGSYVNTANIIGYIYTEENNPTNTLIWPVKFKFRTVYSDPTGPLAQISPRIECGTDEGVENCQLIGGMRSVLLTPGLSVEFPIQTVMNMTNRDKYSFDSMEIRANYNVIGQSLDINSPYLVSDRIPSLRCDVGLAKTGTQGCIFEDAPAVLTRINVNDQDVNESALHIRDAQLSGLPGRYIPEPDSIMPSYESSPLRRLRDLTLRRQNRSKSLQMCLAKFNSYSSTCAPSGDPEDAEVDCDCDEYPFAATMEGAANTEFIPVSVRKIDPSDNRRAGAYLGVFYTQQRVLDGEEFYINVE